MDPRSRRDEALFTPAGETPSGRPENATSMYFCPVMSILLPLRLSEHIDFCTALKINTEIQL